MPRERAGDARSSCSTGGSGGVSDRARRRLEAVGVRREDREEAAGEPACAGAREIEVPLVGARRRTTAPPAARRCVRRRPGAPSRYGDMVQHEPCSIGRAMEVLGERWTFLIVREAFFGVRRFTELQRNLGIARNILSARLQTLTRAGILERIRYQEEPERYEYKLTAMGRDLYPADRLDHALGRRVPRRRRRAAAAAAPPGVRAPRRADDGLQPLRRAAGPAQGRPRSPGLARASIPFRTL